MIQAIPKKQKFKKYLFMQVNMLIGVFLLSGFCTTVFAAGLTIQPIKISHTINPGEEVRGVISLSNASGGETVEITSKIEDFIPAAGSANVQFVGRTEEVSSVRDWISLGDGDSSFSFTNGEARNIPYIIKAPVNAEPGGHFGVIFFRAQKIGDQGQIRVGTQVGILIFVTIPGNHLQKGKILDFTAPAFVNGDANIPFKIKFENTGTVHFEPKGKIAITDMFGRHVADVPVQGEVVLPKGVRDFNIGWEVTGFLFGKYKATLTIVDPNGEVLTGGTISFVSVPLWYLLNFLGGFTVLWIVLRYLKKRVKITFK